MKRFIWKKNNTKASKLAEIIIKRCQKSCINALYMGKKVK